MTKCGWDVKHFWQINTLTRVLRKFLTFYSKVTVSPFKLIDFSQRPAKWPRVHLVSGWSESHDGPPLHNYERIHRAKRKLASRQHFRCSLHDNKVGHETYRSRTSVRSVCRKALCARLFLSCLRTIVCSCLLTGESCVQNVKVKWMC